MNVKSSLRDYEQYELQFYPVNRATTLGEVKGGGGHQLGLGGLYYTSNDQLPAHPWLHPVSVRPQDTHPISNKALPKQPSLTCN